MKYKFFAKAKHLPLFIFIDLTGLLVFFAFFGWLWSFMNEQFTAMMDLIQKINLVGDVTLGPGAAELLSYQAEVMAHYKQILRYVWLLLLAIFIIWVVSQGLNWWFTERLIFKKKHPFFKYLGKFALVSVPWAILLLIAIVIWLKTQAKVYFATIEPVSGWTTLITFFLILFVIGYFAYTSYALIPRAKLGLPLVMKLGKFCFGQWKRFLIADLIIWAILLAEVVAMVLLFRIESIYLSVAVFIFLILPTFAWARIKSIQLVS